MFRKQAQPYVLQPQNTSELALKDIGAEAIERIKLKEVAHIPEFFVITTYAFDHFIDSANLTDSIIAYLTKVEPFIEQSAIDASIKITQEIMNARIPSVILNPIKQAYENLLDTPNRPLIQVIPSNIFDESYIVNEVSTFEMTQGSFDEIETLIKQGWATLFSSKALELRANQYYQGNLSIALVCQRLINSETTGTISVVDDEITIKANYGLFSNQNNGFDKYILNKANFSFKNKFVNTQEKMLVRNRTKNHREKIKEITLSHDWAIRQKLNDEIIKQISQSFLKAIESKEYNSATWAVEAGVVYFLDFGHLRLLDVEDILRKEDSENKVDCRLNIKPLALKIQAQPSKDIEKVKQKVNLLTKQFIDVTSLDNDTIEASLFLDGKFYDGTQSILEKGFLPESKFNESDMVEATNFINSTTLKLTTVAKLANNSSLIYKLSSIGNSEQKLLAVDENDYIYDERFIDKPESLIVESMIIKKCRNINNQKNISVLISKPRSKENISIIKRILAEQGLRRSNSFKLYIEAAFPSLIYDLNNVSTNLVDGIIINVEELVSLHTYRSVISNQDWDIFVNILKKIRKHKDKNLSLSFYLSSTTPPEVLEEIMFYSPAMLIWKQTPFQSILRQLHTFEEQNLENLNKTGRKIKPLYKN